MPFSLYLLAAVGLGMIVAVQPLINLVLARAIGTPYGAAAISIAVAMLGALVLVAVTGRGEMSRATLAAVPWWVYVVGLVGTLFVTGGILITPVTGAALFFVCVVGGQLLGATLADHFGAFGLELRPVSWARLLGLILVVAGAALVQRG